MDDFPKEGIDINYLLRWFDIYPCRVETKGGEIELQVRKFVITSNFRPEEVYGQHEQYAALQRRITVAKILHDGKFICN